MRSQSPQRRILAKWAAEFFYSLIRARPEYTKEKGYYNWPYIFGTRLTADEKDSITRLWNQDIVLEDFLERRLSEYGFSIHDFNLFVEERGGSKDI